MGNCIGKFRGADFASTQIIIPTTPAAATGACTLDDLPNDLKREIAARVGLVDKKSLRLVNKSFRDTVASEVTQVRPPVGEQHGEQYFTNHLTKVFPNVSKKFPEIRRLMISSRFEMDINLIFLIFSKESRESYFKDKIVHLILDKHWNATNDSDLARLKGFTQLESLNLTEVRTTTDVGLAHLKDLPQLRFLKLPLSEITPESVAHLKSLPQLHSLDLSVHEITDAGIILLKELPYLHSLHVTSSKITNAGIAHFKNFPQLESLKLSLSNNHDVTNAGIAHLDDVPQLKWFSINTNCKNIQWLALYFSSAWRKYGYHTPYGV